MKNFSNNFAIQSYFNILANVITCYNFLWQNIKTECDISLIFEVELTKSK